MLFKQRSVYAKALETSSESHLFIISVHFICARGNIAKYHVSNKGQRKFNITIPNNSYFNITGMTVFCNQPFLNVIWNFKFRVPNLKVT